MELRQTLNELAEELHMTFLHSQELHWPEVQYRVAVNAILDSAEKQLRTLHEQD